MNDIGDEVTDLFSAHRPKQIWCASGILHLPGFASTLDWQSQLKAITTQNPFRHMQTPGGREMSAAMTSCGSVGWVSDGKGYRYSPTDPHTGTNWPDMPDAMLEVAQRAARAFGAAGYHPDACLINRYIPGAKMGLHQDRDEADFSQPVVSLSFGATAQFMIGGPSRSDPTRVIQLEHGDALVFGGDARLAYHGIKPLKSDSNQPYGAERYCLTFRKAL